MIRRLRIALVLPLMGLVLPAAAQANVYCVPNLGIKPACQGATQEATVQDGLDAAKAHAGADTVLVGQGSFTGGVYSESADPLNTIDLIGAGTGQTKILVPSQPGSDQGIGLTAPAGSTVSGLTVSIPDDGDTESDRGIFLDFEARADDVAVEADSAADNVDGVVMSGSAALDNSSVHLPADAPSGSIAVHQSSGSPTIADSTLRAATGVTHTGTGFTTRVERSTIEAKLGLSTDVGGMVIRDSVIDLGSHDGAVGLRAANFNDGVSQMVIVATNVTVVGGGADSVGARAEADSEQLDDPVGDDDSQVTEAELDDTVDDGETATVVLNSSIISGPEVSISARADRGESATVTTSYSNYDAKATEEVDDISGKNAQGVATLTQSSQNNLSPDFVAPGAANYHLRPTSALRDIGDPAARRTERPTSTAIRGCWTATTTARVSETSARTSWSRRRRPPRSPPGPQRAPPPPTRPRPSPSPPAETASRYSAARSTAAPSSLVPRRQRWGCSRTARTTSRSRPSVS